MEIFSFLAGLYAGPGIVVAWRNFQGGRRSGIKGPWVALLVPASALIGVLWLPACIFDPAVFRRAMRGG